MAIRPLFRYQSSDPLRVPGIGWAGEKFYKNPSVTCDICICSYIGKGKVQDFKILLIKRKHYPFKGSWAIPGGFLEVDKKETLEQTAARELREETGLKKIPIFQLGAYGDPDRDPRKRVITVAYYAVVPYEVVKMKVKAGDDAAEAKWFSLKKLPKLAFDHGKIIDDLRKALDNTSIVYQYRKIDLSRSKRK